MRTRNVVLSLAATGVFLTIVWLADPLLLVIFGLAPLLWIGVPIFVGSALFLLIAFLRGRSLRPALLIMVTVVGFACAFGLTMAANHYVQELAVESAKEYPARVESALEEYRKIHGIYPATLDRLPIKPAIPRLLRSSYGYQSDGSQYSFSFGKPGGLIDTWDYDSRTKTWHLSD